MSENVLTKLARGAFALGAVAAIPLCLYDVDGGKRAVMFNRFGGVSDQVIGEGSHFYLPWFQIPHLYDITLKPKEIKTACATKDLQTVTIGLRILTRVNTDRLPNLHKTLGPDYEDRVLPSIGMEVLKSIVAQYDAESLLTRRDDVSNDIRRAITTRAARFDLFVDDVAITQLAYGREFSRAIEEKQVAEQEAERSKFVVDRTEQERLSAVIRAEGEAESARLISESIKKSGNAMIMVRKLDAAREIAETLSRNPNVTYLPGGGAHGESGGANPVILNIGR